MAAPVTVMCCPGCGEWHDLLSAPVVWGDRLVGLCRRCLLGEDDLPGYLQLRTKPESLHLYWSPVERRP